MLAATSHGAGGLRGGRSEHGAEVPGLQRERGGERGCGGELADGDAGTPTPSTTATGARSSSSTSRSRSWRGRGAARSHVQGRPAWLRAGRLSEGRGAGCAARLPGSRGGGSGRRLDLGRRRCRGGQGQAMGDGRGGEGPIADGRGAGRGREGGSRVGVSRVVTLVVLTSRGDGESGRALRRRRDEGEESCEPATGCCLVDWAGPGCWAGY